MRGLRLVLLAGLALASAPVAAQTAPDAAPNAAPLAPATPAPAPPAPGEAPEASPAVPPAPPAARSARKAAAPAANPPPSSTGDGLQHARQELLLARKAIGEGQKKQALVALDEAVRQLNLTPPPADRTRKQHRHTVNFVTDARQVTAAGHAARALKLIDAALARLPPTA